MGRNNLKKSINKYARNEYALNDPPLHSKTT